MLPELALIDWRIINDGVKEDISNSVCSPDRHGPNVRGFHVSLTGDGQHG